MSQAFRYIMFDWIEVQTQKIATSPIAGHMLMFLVPKLAFHIKPDFYKMLLSSSRFVFSLHTFSRKEPPCVHGDVIRTFGFVQHHTFCSRLVMAYSITKQIWG